jgi:hypothetical protein
MEYAVERTRFTKPTVLYSIAISIDGYFDSLLADFFDYMSRDRTRIPACRGKFRCRFFRFFYFALASVFVSHAA